MTHGAVKQFIKCEIKPRKKGKIPLQVKSMLGALLWTYSKSPSSFSGHACYCIPFITLDKFLRRERDRKRQRDRESNRERDIEFQKHFIYS